MAPRGDHARLLAGALVFLGLTATCLADCGSQNSFRSDAAEKVRAGFKKTSRGGKTHIDYTKIEVEWQPFLMVEDPDCIVKDRLIMEFKAGNGAWQAYDQTPLKTIGGGRYKWTMDAVPCKSYEIRLWVNGPGGEASYNLEQVISAASEMDIINSGYIPGPPTNIQVITADANAVKMTWTPADCALSYEINYKLSGSGETHVITTSASDGNSVSLTGGLEPCSDYLYEIYAMVGEDGYSEDASGYFSTAPDASAGSKLNPSVKPGVGTISASWKSYDKLSCVKKYMVTLCLDGGACEESEVHTDIRRPYVEFSTDGLQQCSAYTLEIKPLYRGLDIAPKTVSTKTLSPPVDNAAARLRPVEAVQGDAQKVIVSWSAVQCADKYQVYQRVTKGRSDWELVATTKENTIEINSVPCTEYKYGVQVIIDGIESGIVAIDNTITTKLDNSVPFVAPNLDIKPTPDGAVMTWDHGACIREYVILVCTMDAQDKLCEQLEKPISDTGAHNVTFVIQNRPPCTFHTVEIKPRDFDAEAIDFQTAAPEPTPPAHFDAVLDASNNEVDLSWSPVQCATGYKIYQKLDNAEPVVLGIDSMSVLSKSFANPEPCVTYRYGVAAVVGGNGSEPTDWVEVPVPPRVGIDNEPSLYIKEMFNDTVTLEIKSAVQNNNCQVEKYHVKYVTLGLTAEEEKEIPSEEVNNGIIELSFKGASSSSMVVQGRIKYEGFELWSPWISSNDPKVSSPLSGAANSMLVPMVIGILVAVVVVLVIVFFVVRRKKAQNKYDTEKATASQEETRKLNDNPEV